MDNPELTVLINEYNAFVAHCKLGDDVFQHTIFFLLQKIDALQKQVEALRGDV